MSIPDQPIYELTASPRALTEARGKLIENAERLSKLPATPTNFRPLIGSYYRVANEATRRNAAQMQSGFLDYLYAPEPLKVAAETTEAAS